MFSYEDRLRAVRLYIKLDKRIGLTIRQLGYLDSAKQRVRINDNQRGRFVRGWMSSVIVNEASSWVWLSLSLPGCRWR